MKALYLDGSRGIEVRLNGPALRVRRPAKADGQYPLQRVARVVTLGRVHWHKDALDACISWRKPVAVLDAKGRFVRIWFRPSVPVYGLIRHLGSLLGVPRFLARYERWFSGAERSEMIRAIDALHIECGRRHPDMTWQAVCFHQYLRHNKRVGKPSVPVGFGRGADFLGALFHWSPARSPVMGKAGIPAVFRHDAPRTLEASCFARATDGAPRGKSGASRPG